MKDKSFEGVLKFLEASKSEKEFQKIQKYLEEANKFYREGNPIISDKEYDFLLDIFKKLTGREIILNNENSSSRKQNLPILMASLEKITTVEELEKWRISKKLKESTSLILTPKLDGISLLIDELQDCIAWTKGDGKIGQFSGEHFKFLLKKEELKLENFYSFGEAIIKIEIFNKKYKDKEIEGKIYKVPRNMVAGLFNSNIPPSFLKDINYIRYGLVNKEGEEFENKGKQLEILNERNLFKIPYIKTNFFELKKDIYFLNLYEEFRKTGFEIDGIVIDIDEINLRKKLGREINGNPAYARAFKGDFEEIKKTVVKSINWKVSKHGYLKPVAIIEPIILEGAQVTNVTLYNAKYLREHNPIIGAKITIKRSGKVIPKIVEWIEEGDEHELIDSCPSCGNIFLNWNESEVELCCNNENCSGRILAQLVEFFTILEVENFEESTIEKLFSNKYLTPHDILKIKKEDLLKIEGFGETSIKNLFEQFKQLKKEGVTLFKLQAASGCYPGLGEKTLELFPEEEVNEDELLKLKGVGEKTLKIWLEGNIRFKKFLKDLPIRIKKEEIVSEKYKDFNIVFTGFRDSTLEKIIRLNGGIIGNSVSSKTTHLLVIEKGSGTSKETKAIELNLPILTKEEFLKLYE